jgi:hypothetical protein
MVVARSTYYVWKPKLERYGLDGLRHNTDHAHTGRHTQGRLPADIVFGARKTRTVR